MKNTNIFMHIHVLGELYPPKWSVLTYTGAIFISIVSRYRRIKLYDELYVESYMRRNTPQKFPLTGIWIIFTEN
jgi:hypothetical protein